jgi:hypothetical protein
MKDLPSIFFLILISAGFVCCGKVSVSAAGTTPVSHEILDGLLKKYVKQDGMVDYQGLKTERNKLNEYLDLLTSNPPNDENWSEDEQLAYWINLYNAFTLDLILDHYPLKSIKDIGSSIQIPFVNSPWDIKFIEINGEKYDLNNIEHGIIRKNFNEPRIHFAVNCASFSCPKLRPEAYVGDRLDAQLEEQTIDFINDPDRNQIMKGKLKLSKIFLWYSGDFKNGQSLTEFIRRYSQTSFEEDPKVNYMEYDWSLNESI